MSTQTCACGQPAEVGPYTGDADHCRAHWGIADTVTAANADNTELEQAARIAVQAYDSSDMTEDERGMTYSESLESAMFTLRDVLARLDWGSDRPALLSADEQLRANLDDAAHQRIRHAVQD